MNRLRTIALATTASRTVGLSVVVTTRLLALAHPRGIEDDDINEQAWAQQAAVH